MTTLFAIMMPGALEMVIVAIVAVLLFGSRLPKVAYSIGNSFQQLKAGLNDTSNELSSVKEQFSSIKDSIEEQRTDLGAAVNTPAKQPVHKA